MWLEKDKLRGQFTIGSAKSDEPVSCAYDLQQRRDLQKRGVGVSAGRSRNAAAERDRTVPTFPQECQRYLNVRRLHKLVLVSENVVHCGRVRGVQSRGLGETNEVSTVKASVT